MNRKLSLVRLPAALCLLAAMPLGCSSGSPVSGDDDLTSLTARSRKLEFSGYVYVDPGADDDFILRTVRKQTQSAFGALRTAEISVNSRELKEVDSATFVKENVLVVDSADPSAEPAQMMRVRYRYEDDAVVPVSMAKRSALPLAVMTPGYQSQVDRVIRECTANDSHAQEFRSSIWYEFNPSRRSCQDAIQNEQAAIDAAKEAITLEPTEGSTFEPKEEIDRLYIPITVSLGKDQTNDDASYPEYARLYAGGVEKDTIVIGLVNGWVDKKKQDYTDWGYSGWFEELEEVFKARPGFELTSIEDGGNLADIPVGDRTVSFDSFHDLVALELHGESKIELDHNEKRELRKAASERIIGKWLTFEAKATVKIGDEPARPFTYKVITYFGAGHSSVPHKHAIKHADIFAYNGHSYIGYGPLDPSGFSAEDFPASYQMLFINGCVSYNYYEKDYIPLKEGGTQNLDLVTNGLATPVWGSGTTVGRFIGGMIDGQQKSYHELLQLARSTDTLRVVDGELDNTYDPADTPIVVE